MTDGLGLLAQGGGARGSFTMGALAYLESLKLTDKFDICIGNSAGAVSLAYFVAGQAREVSEPDNSFWDAINAQRVINPLRFWRVYDVDRLIDRIIFGALPLDVDALRSNPTKFFIGLTDAKLRLIKYALAQECDDQGLRKLIRATCALPGLWMGKTTIDGRNYLDGGFVDPLPIFRLKFLGCERIVVITTSPLEYSFTHDSWLRRSFIKLMATGKHRLIRQWIGTPNPLHDENLEALLWWAKNPAESGVLAISPETSLPALSRDPTVHKELFDTGMHAAKQAVASVPWLYQSVVQEVSAK